MVANTVMSWVPAQFGGPHTSRTGSLRLDRFPVLDSPSLSSPLLSSFPPVPILEIHLHLLRVFRGSFVVVYTLLFQHVAPWAAGCPETNPNFLCPLPLNEIFWC